jgi:hypothetical protein
MRAFFYFLLSVVVAFQGIANAHILQQPCPMEHMQAASVMADADVDADAYAYADDCCNDAATAAQTGKLCKTSAPCSSVSNACMLPSARAKLPAVQGGNLAPVVQPHNTSFTSPSVWRPPLLS